MTSVPLFENALALIWRCPVCGLIDAAAVEHDDQRGQHPTVERVTMDTVRREPWCACRKEQK